MQLKNTIPAAAVRGYISVYQHDEHNNLVLCFGRCNQIQLGWAHIITKLLAGYSQYRISGMYVEFENVANPADPVTAPSFLDTDGIEYYSDLELSVTRDFLRVPLIQAGMIGVTAGYDSFFPDSNTGNSITFYAQTQGSAGVHGKTFSNAANSKVFGLALVATPVWGDRTQDVIFARVYFDTGEQLVKPASSQLALSWQLPFSIPSIGT